MTNSGRPTRKRPEVEERKTSGEEIPPPPVLRRMGDEPGAGANTPSGPFPRRGTEQAKRARRKQDQTQSK